MSGIVHPIILLCRTIPTQSLGANGLVTNTKDTTVILKISDNVKVEFEKSAIQSITKKSNAPQDADTDS